MRTASQDFADDPCSSVKRGTMVRAARALLSAVTRLLILAGESLVTCLTVIIPFTGFHFSELLLTV